MIAKTLNFCGVGPYVGQQSINFEQLNNSKLFLISGLTGSGKSYILDCLMQALYGEGASPARNDLQSMRCKLCEPAQKTHIDYTFQMGDKQYKFERGLKSVNKRDGSIEYNEYCNAFESLDGVFQPIFENPRRSEVTAYAEQIIGLNAEQFRQVVILPQGKFESFLLAKVEEKESILKTLFGTVKWEKVTNEIKEKSLICKREYELLESQIKSVFNSERVTDINGLQAQIQCAQEQLNSLNEQIQTHKQSIESINRLINEMSVLESKFIDLRKLGEDIFVQKQLEPEVEKRKQHLISNKNAERLHPTYSAYEKCKTSFAKHKQEYMQTQDRLKLAEADMNNAISEANALKQQCDKAEQIKLRLMNYENAVEAYKGLAECEKNHKRLQEVEKQLFVSVNVLQESKAKALQVFKNNASIILSSELKEGQPCPVCGSLTHNITIGNIQNNGEDFFTVECALEKANAEYLSVKQQLFEAQSLIKQYSSKLVDGVCDIDKLREIMQSDKLYISDYEKASERSNQRLISTQSNYNGITQALIVLKQNLIVEKRELDEDKASFLDNLGKVGFRDVEHFKSFYVEKDELDENERRINVFYDNLTLLTNNHKLLQAELVDKTQPDLSKYREELSKISAQYDILQKQHGSITNELQLKRKVLQRAENIIQKRGKAFSEYVFVGEFAKRLSGENSISLQNYILSKALNEVTCEANSLLADIDGGRYQLAVDTGRGGRKKKFGLNLCVLDSYSATERDVSTLSGGEKFYVALSLCLGLTSVVQSQNGGMRMQTLFIDEGFGTLSNQVLEDSLGILTRLVGGEQVVGIISHVEKLKESIATRVNVVKTDRGSSLSIQI